MPQIDVVEAKTWHCGRMARLMRHDHQSRLARCGLDPHRELRRNFEASSWVRTALMDGQIVAMAGIIGSDIASTGFLWLVLSQQAMRHPVAMIRLFRRELDRVMSTRHELATLVGPDDPAAVRLAVFMGFHCEHDGEGSPAMSRFGRRQLARFVTNNTELRMPFGTGYGIPMGYHRDQHDFA